MAESANCICCYPVKAITWTLSKWLKAIHSFCIWVDKFIPVEAHSTKLQERQSESSSYISTWRSTGVWQMQSKYDNWVKYWTPLFCRVAGCQWQSKTSLSLGHFFCWGRASLCCDFKNKVVCAWIGQGFPESHQPSSLGHPPGALEPQQCRWSFLEGCYGVRLAGGCPSSSGSQGGCWGPGVLDAVLGHGRGLLFVQGCSYLEGKVQEGLTLMPWPFWKSRVDRKVQFPGRRLN